MSEYRETRQHAIAILEYLEQVNTEISQLGTPSLMGLKLTKANAEDAVRTAEPMYTEKLLALRHEPSLQTVLAAEPELKRRLGAACAFWQGLESVGLTEHRVLTSDPDAVGDAVVTRIPPEPPGEVTGETVHDYLVSLRQWIADEQAELWDGDAELALPKLGGRYGLGDFRQLVFVVEQLKDGDKLRKHWLKLAECGNYWNHSGIGASRAQLLYVARDILVKIINPPTEDPGGNPFASLMQQMFSGPADS